MDGAGADRHSSASMGDHTERIVIPAEAVEDHPKPIVIPAEAGIHAPVRYSRTRLDPGFGRSDG